jgi:hypothetical protein
MAPFEDDKITIRLIINAIVTPTKNEKSSKSK